MFNFSLYSYGKYLLKYKIKKILLESASKIGGIEREVKSLISKIKPFKNSQTRVGNLALLNKAFLIACSSLKMFYLPTLFAIFALTFSACASKPVYKVQIKEVFIPVKCNLKLPKKPQENGSFASHRALAKYYLEIEQIAKDCNVTSK